MTTKSYMLLCPSAGLVKIGKSEHPIKRMLALRTMNAAEVEPLVVLNVPESWLHDKFDRLRHHGEWFTLHADMVQYLNWVDEALAADRLQTVMDNHNA